MTGDTKQGPVDWRAVGRSTWVAGSMGSLASTLALMGLARAEGHGALQPANATSHWLNGPEAARVTRADLIHSAVGLATHHAATLFWALPFSAWLHARPRRSAGDIVGGALVTSVVAVAVDYGATPKRFTPGWEFVLSKRAMALTYLAMAGGLAAGALLSDRAARR